MKICTKCGIEKSKSEFYKSNTSKDGYRSNCKVCRGISQKKYDEKNKEKIDEKKKEWALKNKDKLNAISKKWKKDNREKYLEGARRYANKRYKDNIERERQRCKEWRKNNREIYLESNKLSCKKRYKNNKEYYSEQNKKWKEANHEKVLEQARKDAAVSRLRYPEKARARMLVRLAIKIGSLTRPKTCSRCLKE